MKEIRLMFYRSKPSPENLGMKQVLFKITEVTTDGKDFNKTITYDFGYADWLGTEWDVVPTPEGFMIEIHSWANNPDPKHLIDESRIITMRK